MFSSVHGTPNADSSTNLIVDAFIPGIPLSSWGNEEVDGAGSGVCSEGSGGKDVDPSAALEHADSESAKENANTRDKIFGFIDILSFFHISPPSGGWVTITFYVSHNPDYSASHLLLKRRKCTLKFGNISGLTE